MTREKPQNSSNMKLLQNVPRCEGFQCHLTGGVKWGKTVADKGDDTNASQERK